MLVGRQFSQVLVSRHAALRRMIDKHPPLLPSTGAALRSPDPPFGSENDKVICCLARPHLDLITALLLHSHTLALRTSVTDAASHPRTKTERSTPPPPPAAGAPRPCASGAPPTLARRSAPPPSCPPPFLVSSPPLHACLTPVLDVSGRCRSSSALRLSLRAILFGGDSLNSVPA